MRHDMVQAKVRHSKELTQMYPITVRQDLGVDSGFVSSERSGHHTLIAQFYPCQLFGTAFLLLRFTPPRIFVHNEISFQYCADA